MALEEKTSELPAADQDRLLRGLALAHLRLDDLAGAERLYSQLAQRRPDDLGVRLSLFDLATKRDLRPDMERWLAEIRSLDSGEAALSRFCEARFLIWRARHEGRGGAVDRSRLEAAPGLD